MMYQTSSSMMYQTSSTMMDNSVDPRAVWSLQPGSLVSSSASGEQMSLLDLLHDGLRFNARCHPRPAYSTRATQNITSDGLVLSHPTSSSQSLEFGERSATEQRRLDDNVASAHEGAVPQQRALDRVENLYSILGDAINLCRDELEEEGYEEMDFCCTTKRGAGTQR